jgi:hypothetical protein
MQPASLKRPFNVTDLGGFQTELSPHLRHRRLPKDSGIISLQLACRSARCVGTSFYKFQEDRPTPRLNIPARPSRRKFSNFLVCLASAFQYAEDPAPSKNKHQDDHTYDETDQVSNCIDGPNFNDLLQINQIGEDEGWFKEIQIFGRAEQ